MDCHVIMLEELDEQSEYDEDEKLSVDESVSAMSGEMPTQHVNNLAVLKDMGFPDEERNSTILEEFDGDVEKAANFLLGTHESSEMSGIFIFLQNINDSLFF